MIEWSVKNRALVLMLTLLCTAFGVVAARNIRLDAIPDLSDVQVIVTTEYPGQNPQVVDDQVTLPLSTALLSVPGASTVRGFSMFEQSFVYVIFEDGTDLYWARSRVLETLSSARDRLPASVQPKLGPDATGVGWVYQYALYPGWFSPDYPQGLWRDEEQQRWYGKPEDAPAERRAQLVRVRAFEEPGQCPITGKALVSSGQDLASLRSLQDWYLRFPLAAVPGVAEVAPIGGFVRQYQVVLDPERLRSFGIPLNDVVMGVERSNQDIGGSVVERSETEFMVRSRGYVQGVADLERVVVGRGAGDVPVLLRDVGRVEIGGESRRGVSELDGRGEAVGGVIVARFGENAAKVIRDAKARIYELESGLPPGVFVKPTYDRSALIDRAVGTLKEALLEELLVTALICIAFLLHFRSAFVALVVLPIGLLVSVLLMQQFGINANIMSLGGLALAIGVMVDSGIVMIENAHRHLELERERVDEGGSARPQVEIVLEAAKEVGPSLFFSLLVITVAFLPIFVLGDQSGRMFKPLAFTKTFAMAAGAVLGITVIPVLMVFFVRGKIPREDSNPLNRWTMRLYEPFFHAVLRHPWLTLVTVIALGASAFYPAQHLGSEFMPALDEGDLLYMPTTEPSISVGKAQELLQQTDKLIRTAPEVKSVHGKIGRADSATDPAPLSMLETVVQLETDQAKWRTRSLARFYDGWPKWLAWPFEHSFWPAARRITTQELVYGWTDPDGTLHQGLNTLVSFPGLANAWLHPIDTRITMLSTGIKTPVGVKLFGPDLAQLDQLAGRVTSILGQVHGTTSAYAEPIFGGHYLDFDIDREIAARYGLTTGDVQDVIQTAIGGMNVSTTVQGIERYPINVRFARELRDEPEQLARVLVPTRTLAQIPLGTVAKIVRREGAPMVRNEDGQHTAWIFVDVSGRDIGGWLADAKARVEREVELPQGYSINWAGQFQQLEKANQRLLLVLPVTLALIVLLLYLANKSWFRVAVILLAVPFSLIGAFWFLWLLDYHMSVAVWVGIIALLGIDAETGQMMLLYLDTSFERWKKLGRMSTHEHLLGAIHEGAVKRIRPKTMTVATDMLGLLPLLWATGTGAELTRRLVAPLVGGISVSFAMELLVYPVIFYLWKRREIRG
ncbi:MAG: efflux RND transporter permease subunit [Planctomycetes bacterium]|nr:efflux RND transporter permease subunit [Planctomycetota bacterium]